MRITREQEQATLARLAKKTGVTVVVLQEIMSAAGRVWDEIGDDYLALGEGKTIRRSEVIEAVLDASRLETMGRLSPEALTFIKGSYNDLLFRKVLDALMKLAFPNSRYGY